MEAKRIYNALDPSQNDPVDALINATKMIDFVCEDLTLGDPNEPYYEMSKDARSGLFYILDSVRWSLESIAEKLMSKPEKSKNPVGGVAQRKGETK